MRRRMALPRKMCALNGQDNSGMNRHLSYREQCLIPSFDFAVVYSFT